MSTTRVDIERSSPDRSGRRRKLCDSRWGGLPRLWAERGKGVLIAVDELQGARGEEVAVAPPPVDR